MPTPDATSGASDSRDLDAKSKPRKKRTLNPFRAIHRLWVHSLQFRSVTSAGIMMLIAFIAVGTSLSNQIATSLFENKKNQALEETSKGFETVQRVLDPISAREDSEVRRTVKHNLTVLDAGGDTQRRWVLVSLDQQSKKGFIPEQSSDNAPLDASVIPTDFKDTVRDSPGVFWEKTTLSEPGKSNGEPYPALIIGTSVSIPQNPNYGLFMVYDLSESDSTITYINVVLGTGFTVLLILVLSIVWFVTRLVVRPITSTAITAEKLAAGDLNRRVNIRGKHQAARLGISFNKMADSLQEQITQLERLSTLQQRFVSDVSHELRTPLSTVRLSSELLYDSRDTLNPVQSRSVELMHNQVDRFQALLSDLLEISRFDAGSAVLNIDAEDFMSVLNDVLVEVIPHLERTGTRLIVHSEQAHIDIDIDRVRIERVLRNLLFNAIEHGESKPVDIYIATNATNLGVAVRDHGIGLSEEEAAQVFNRFWRADTSRKRTLGGTGLGLSITAEDVRLHGGRIEAWGIKGKGACFTMNLPLVQGGELGPSPVLITGEPEPEAYAHSALAGDTLSTSLRKTRHETQDDASEGQV